MAGLVGGKASDVGVAADLTQGGAGSSRPAQSEKGKDAATAAMSGGATGGSSSGERVEQMMARLRLTAAEAKAVVIDDADDPCLVDPDRAFVGKVLAPNVLHINTISAAMRPAWGNPRGLLLNPAGDNLFIAEFGSMADRDRVMEGSLWMVGKHAVLMKKYDVEVQPDQVVFDRLAIWARIISLPNRLMTADRGMVIAAPIGVVKRVESDALGRCWGGYMRLRVEVKVDEPLMRAVTVFSSRLQIAESFAVQYERLPIYCFSCGLLGHSTLACPNPADRDEFGELPYSAKRLSADDPSRKSGGSKSGNNAAASTAQSGTAQQGARGDRSEAQMVLFRECLDACNLADLGFVGPKFTWSNRQDAQCNIRVRLDRAVANESFSCLFQECSVENIITTSSDHYAILVSLCAGDPHLTRSPVQQGFRYEAMWRRADDYAGVVEAAWNVNGHGPNVLHATWANIGCMASSLRDWSKTLFGSVRREISRLERVLRSLRSVAISDDVIAEEKQVERQLCELFEREEIMARQRSRVDWLREGDRNTAFFHSKATARKRTNRISALVREDGSVCEDQTEIKSMVHHFYEDLFSSEPVVSMDAVLDAIPLKVDDQMNASLCKEYSNEEIKTALFQMGPTKAPGPDGFPAMFYQVHWELVENDVCNAVRSFLGGADIPEGFCDSVIVLIPKKLDELLPEQLANNLVDLKTGRV
ncbi:hypothetical protein ACQ4PT_058650 [Festuca glaucescens]